MKHLGRILLCLGIALPVLQGRAGAEKSAVNVRSHPDFASKHLNNKRNLRVYLPPGYDTDKEKRYPVFYLHDAQMRLQAEETVERLIRAGKIRPVILVLIANTKDRFDEYTYHPWAHLTKG